MKPIVKLTTGCLVFAASAQAASLLSPGDFIIAVNPNTSAPASSYPAGEAPPKAIDGVAPAGSNKYLNFGGFGTGFIATPASPSVFQSFTITTGGDAPGRDPASYEIYGTNDAIVSADNSTGSGESWTLISSGSLALSGDRNAVSAPISFANGTSYSSYKVVFPKLKADDRMQIGEFTAYTGSGGTGSSIFSSSDPILAIDTPVSASRHPLGEPALNLIDGASSTKYLNFGKNGSGFIVTPSVGLSVVESMTLTSAGDAASFSSRNPAMYEIYGTNQSISSTDNSYGNEELWVLIASGALDDTQMPITDETEGVPVTFTNGDAYTSYKVIFTELVDADNANSMQLAEVQFGGTIVPEPSSALLAPIALAGMALRRRR